MGLLQLVLQSTLMALGTFAMGSAPLSIPSLSKPRSASVGAISIFSVGLLIATALAVIIPEGMAVVLSSVQNGKEGEGEGEVHEHVEDPHDSAIGIWVGSALCAGFLLMFCVHQYASDEGHLHQRNKLSLPIQTPNKRFDGSNREPDSAIGSEQGYPIDGDAEHREGAQGEYFTVATRSRRASESAALDPLDSRSPAFSTFIGLLFHALADGISLGAAASFPAGAVNGTEHGGMGEGGSELSFLVFISLLIHKAPVAFSLSALLLSHAPPSSLATYKNHIRKALVWFALATPAGAVATWVLLKTITLISWSESMNEGAEEDGNVEGIFAGNMRGRLEFWTGMALLFSAGTFLFVSTHLMAEMDSASGNATANTPSEPLATGLATRSKRSRIGLFLLGMTTPLVLSTLFGHHHGQ